MPIKIDFISNVRDLLRGTKQAEDAFDDVADSLDDVARDGDQSLGRLEKSFRELAREARDTSKDVDKVGDSSKAGFGKAGAATGEFKSEALANFSEVTSSFDGSMESITELAQGTLGGVAGALPGVGVAAGIAAVGIGAITSELQAAAERSAEVTKGIVDDFVEMGDALDAEAVSTRVKSILGDEETRRQAELLAELLGTTVPNAALAMAGDFEAAGTTVEETVQAIAEAPSTVDTSTWQRLSDHIDATTRGLEEGEEAARRIATAMDIKARADLNAAIATGKVTKEVDDLGNELYTMPDGKQVLIRADTRQATFDVDKFKEDVDGVPESVETRVKFTADTAQVDAARRRLQQKITIGVDAIVRAGQVAWQ